MAEMEGALDKVHPGSDGMQVDQLNTTTLLLLVLVLLLLLPRRPARPPQCVPRVERPAVICRPLSEACPGTTSFLRAGPPATGKNVRVIT